MLFFFSNFDKTVFNFLNQNRGSSASEMEMERLKADCKRSVLMVDRYKKMYEDLQEFYEDDFLKSGQTKTLDETGS